MGSLVAHDRGLNLKATELRLGLPGRDDEAAASDQEMEFSPKNNKRSLSDQLSENKETNMYINLNSTHDCQSDTAPSAKAQIVGWPPVRSSKKNSNSPRATAATEGVGEGSGIYVKVSMDGAPYLRKIDLKGYKGYNELLKALEDMFNLKFGEYTESEGYKGSSYAAAYEDGDGDMMLVGDVPWGMFLSSCKRFRIMKASEAKGMGCGL